MFVASAPSDKYIRLFNLVTASSHGVLSNVDLFYSMSLHVFCHTVRSVARSVALLGNLVPRPLVLGKSTCILSLTMVANFTVAAHFPQSSSGWCALSQ